jgi:hypothetical protein
MGNADILRKALDERFRNRMADGDTTEWDTYAALDALVAEIAKGEEIKRVLTELLHDVWRSYSLIEGDQAHLDHSMEAVEQLLFGERRIPTGDRGVV